MKKGIFLLIAVVIFGLQTVSAQNTYLHWVYWVNDLQHQITPTELAEITSDLYGVNGKIINPNQVYKLSSGVTYKIPQPSLFLAYIEKAVQASKPSATTMDAVIDAIKRAEKMRWDNNVSVTGVKNYYYSSAHKKVQSLDNYNGEGKNVDFLFIEGKPTFKCDCVNALLNSIPTVIVKKKEETTGGLLGDSYNLDNDLPRNLGITEKKKTVIPDIKAPVLENPNHPHTLLWVGVGILATSLVYGIHELGEKHGGGQPVTAPGHTDPNTGGPVTAPGHGDAFVPLYNRVFLKTTIIQNQQNRLRMITVAVYKF